MYRPIKKDPRWTISREWTGQEKPQFVVRFCDDWIGQRAFFDSAVMLAVGENARRNAALVVEGME